MHREPWRASKTTPTWPSASAAFFGCSWGYTPEYVELLQLPVSCRLPLTLTRHPAIRARLSLWRVHDFLDLKFSMGYGVHRTCPLPSFGKWAGALTCITVPLYTQGTNVA